MFYKPESAKMIRPENALKGRDSCMEISAIHTVNGHTMSPPFEADQQLAMFGLGCFWGAERKLWTLDGVDATAVGYSAGFTPNPNYQEVCSGSTGHNEVVLIIFKPSLIHYKTLLKVFWESHNPTQGMQQGNDVGTQYRSGIYTYNTEQFELATQSLFRYQQALNQHGLAPITTEIKPATEFYYAEEYHQQYLHKNPDGYCGLGGCGIPLQLST